ncbi:MULTISPECIES: cation diffusion facilitator family transporter [Vagococcus]|uniref:Cobalt-zinc-cadmium resistance protein n=1 Tax=Vagococcus fluvialis bH819 TaxID=1255619 RepID=A0A1X6WL74_9ENTE|nr:MULTISPECIES: cation diffusion facilitator family transporter [Vagococcus]SLM85091.1 Cobalt-zinc-cadmium resistance protein [Vagococcus fluvialis bH819]HCM88493.1 cation transporter [Vagococcus sp.]
MKPTVTNRKKYVDNTIKSIKIAYVNLIVLVIVFIVEVMIAQISGSKALLAASFNNLSSIIIAMGIILGLKVALKDPSHSHSKGYQQFETLGNLFSSFVMFLMSVYIVIEGIKSVYASFSKKGIPPSELPIFIALGAGVIMLVVYLFNSRFHQKISNNAVNTLKKDSLSDFLMNIGTAAGLFLTLRIHPVFDGLTAVFLGIVLVHMSYMIVKENVFYLSGGFDPEMIVNYHHVIERLSGVERIVDITGKMFGDAIAVDITIEVDKKLTIEEAALITENIEYELTSRFDIFDVDVQVKPKRS